MITLQDLESAIAECQGQRNPNASTCIKLAAFLTIRQELFGDKIGKDPGDKKMGVDPGAPVIPAYSASASPAALGQTETFIDYDSGSEFSKAIDGKDAYAVWCVVDELMDVLSATNSRLYSGVLRKMLEI